MIDKEYRMANFATFVFKTLTATDFEITRIISAQIALHSVQLLL